MAERPFLLEASCGRCGETFIPTDESDLVHLQQNDGTECGGKAHKVIGHFAPPYMALRDFLTQGGDDA